MTDSLLPQPEIDWGKLKRYRLTRLRDAMRANNVGLAILTNPLSMRYAIDYWNYPLFLSRIPTTQLFIPLDNAPIAVCGAYAHGNNDIEIHYPMLGLTAFDGGLQNQSEARKFAQLVKDYLTQHGLFEQGIKIGLDRMDANVFHAFHEYDLEYCDVTTIVEKARAIKSPEELMLIRHSIAVAELGMQRMYEHLEPGITECRLWSYLHQTNITHGGYWTDGNMLASGKRTNPWLQDVSHKTIQAGDTVTLDTDMIGPNAYLADISRAWVCGDETPSKRQLELHQQAYNEVYHNMELIRPGVSYKEFSDRALRLPEKYHAQRYPCVAHGAGMCDEYPKIAYWQDWDRLGYDGVFEPGMVICVESYIGETGGEDGVKFEEQVLVTESGFEKLTRFSPDLVP